MLDNWLRELLAEMKQGLGRLYGDRLKGVYLYGSRARGEAQPDSDVDILVVLDEIDHYYGELERTAALVSSLSLRYDVSISRMFLPASEWRQGEGPFLLTVREDAVAA
jgi:predicted nucleotidyltransferase